MIGPRSGFSEELINLGSVLTARFPSDPGSAALLESALQLLAAPIGLGKIIIGQLTPLLLDLAFGCLPFFSMRFQSILFAISRSPTGSRLPNKANVSR